MSAMTSLTAAVHAATHRIKALETTNAKLTEENKSLKAEVAAAKSPATEPELQALADELTNA